jgi:beta-1,4-mannosyltransferase
VVSSTSWTPDEDLWALLAAAVEYDAAAAAPGSRLPPLLLVVTGSGPARAAWLADAAALRLRRVALAAAWLEAGDYPRLLACADAGVSLHTSSSGLDLPMKVVDMFGAGLPVLAARFECVEELVAPGATGRLFSGAPELGAALRSLLGGLQGEDRTDDGELARLRRGVQREQGLRWEENWACVAGPLLARAAAGRRRPLAQVPAP